MSGMRGSPTPSNTEEKHQEALGNSNPLAPKIKTKGLNFSISTTENFSLTSAQSQAESVFHSCLLELLPLLLFGCAHIKGRINPG